MNLSKKRCTQAGFHVSSGVLALVLVFCVGIVFNPGLFLSHSNMQNILRQTVTNALLAYGMAFVIISGSIDLSVAATVAMSGYITVWLLPYSFALALAAAVLFGVAVGTINGYLIAKVKFPANDSNLFHAAYDKGAYSGFNQWNHAENKYGQSYYEISGTCPGYRHISSAVYWPVWQELMWRPGQALRLPGLATDMICWPLPLWSSEGYP